MKITLLEKDSLKRLKTAKATKETLKGKGSPTNKDIAEMLCQILDLVVDLHEKAVE